MGNRSASFTSHQLQFIIDHAEEFTVMELAASLRLSKQVVYCIGYRYHLDFKRINRKVKGNPPIRERRPVPAGLLPDPPAPKVERVKGEYSNSGYLNLINQLT